MKKVKIYGTAGPACWDYEILKGMFREGMNGIRLNLSHITLEEAADLIEACYKAANECGINPEVMIDLQGPELRLGTLEEPVRLEDDDLIGIDDLPFPENVKESLIKAAEGQEVLLDDGKILLRKEVQSKNQDIRLRVIRGGMIESRKSAALPGLSFHTPAMTQKDLCEISKAGASGVTAVMQPFVRSREDLIEVRSALDRAGCEHIKLFAKIENKEGINNLKELIPYCDEVVIARGDLGNSMELWELPAAQKRIASICRSAGRNFMVVTQMLDSMIYRQVPTRAEVSDIFNAVLDGASSVMVTGETASGKYPVQTIRYLSRTAQAAETFLLECSKHGSPGMGNIMYYSN